MKIFEVVAVTEDAAKALAAQLETKYNLQTLDLFTGKDGTIELSSIVVNKEDRKSGTGSAVMQELIKFADANSSRIVLDPSNDLGGSSRSRLVKFYKQFGFVENKGRNKDYSTRAGMFRDPQNVNEAEQTLKLPSISVGDEVRVGKFKNRKAEVTGFDKDENNHPVLKTTKGNQQVFKPRLSKLLPSEKSK